ncbi:MAG: hypothetical protein ABI217_08465 [Chthoniobacterales bacterium]
MTAAAIKSQNCFAGLTATHAQRLRFLSVFLAAFLVKSAIASPPPSFSLPDFTVSPDHRYGILLPEEDHSLPNVPGNQLVEIATDRVITTIKAQTGLSDDEDSKTVRWSNDNSLCLWEVEGRWSPRILVLIKIEDGKCPWQIDLLKIGQQEILARTRKAAPGKYAAAKQQNKGNGTAFPDGFTVNVRVEGEIQNVRSGNPEAGLKGPPVALPLKFHAELTSNPKQIERWPKEAQLDSALDGLVTVDGKVTVTRFRLRGKPYPSALSGSWSELAESRTEESERPRQGQVDHYKVPAASDVRPLDSSSPVLQNFAPPPAAPNPATPNAPSFGFDPRKPLLTITSVRNFTANPDGGVTLVLNEKDKNRWSELTHEFEGKMLISVGSNEVTGIAKITSPTDNGIIEFSEAHYSGNIAKYLRRRFGK